MIKRLLILLTLLLAMTSLVYWNLDAMQVVQAQQESQGPQAPTAGPDPAVDPNILLLNTQPVPVNQHLALQVVITNVGDSDMTTDGLLTVYAAMTHTLTTTWPLAELSFAPLTPTAAINLPVYVQQSLLPGTYYIYAQVTYTDDADLTNNLAGPITVTVVANESISDILAGRHSNGLLNTQNLAVFGPLSCTRMGDPFSPDASPWAPGLYTYRFRILIPPDYPYDVVRVELFDPDSINQATNTHVVYYSDLAQSLGMPPSQTLSCSASGRYQPCRLDTGEATLGVTLDDINPFWFVRIDENRYGTSGNNSNCGSNSYQAAQNTQTVYQLYYLAQNPDGTAAQVDLAAYTGQVGDGVRDDGGHLTDMQWVAPGAPASMAQPANVPTNCGSPNGGDYDPVTCPGGTTAGAGSGFEVDLSQDTPGMVTDPTTGNRYLYLDITTVSGASENGFDIWAGPNVYTNDVTSDVNIRNLQLLNDYGSHASKGVTVLAINNLPLNSDTYNRVEIPLAEVGPEYAGETIAVSLFDSDSGASPPLHFYFDSIAFDDWHVTVSTDGGRCQIGACNDQWVTPPYTFTVPGDLENCDYDNPDDSCIPFYGGRLVASYISGIYDTYGWQVELPPAPELDTTQSCAAFPITVHEDIRSVNPPGSPINPYPSLSEFTGPSNPPTYTDFIDHVPDVPLSEAQQGYVYLAYNGIDVGNSGWLLWNTGNSANANTLNDSMTWPGDSQDYTNAGTCLVGVNCPTPLYPHRVAGYVNPDDVYDLSLQQTDWVLANTGVSNSSALRTTLNGHIGQSRQLRLLVWDDFRISGNIGAYRTARFAIFRLAGYNFGNNWLLLEFMHWDDSCGQPALPANISIDGAATGYPQQTYTFTAQVNQTSTQPITYTWQATEQNVITHTGGVSDTVLFSWTDVGQKEVMVTAVTPMGTLTATHAITIFPDDLTLSITVVGAGAVERIPDLAVYPYGTVVTLTAVPDAGSMFTHWGDDLSGSNNPETLLMNGNRTVSAYFTPIGDPLDSVTITGPTIGLLDTSYTFTATAAPDTALLPITYTWQAASISGTLIHSGGVSATAVFQWDDWGEKVVTVTAVNPLGISVTTTHTITITPWQLYLPIALKPN
ncbi:MAG: hypothetical protein R3E31_18725 [Chloroflexota bacterium]